MLTATLYVIFKDSIPDNLGRETEKENKKSVDTILQPLYTMNVNKRANRERRRTPIPYSEAQKRATMKYNAKYMKKYTVNVNKKTEPEIYDFMERSSNKQATIKEGINLLIEREKSSENS